MFKGIALAVGAGVLAWSYFSGSKISEPHVHAFYQKTSQAFMARDPEAMCKLHSRHYVGHERMSVMGTAQEVTLDRDQACENAQTAFQSFAQIGSQMGGMLTIDYDYRIDDITITHGGKRARVTGSRWIRMGETTMQFDTDFTEEVAREWGQARLVRSDTTTRMRMAGARAMDQGSFFK